MKYYIISGEASGDMHGANLIKSLAAEDPQAEFRCWGGDLMQAAGATVVKHYKDLAFMGFAEVAMHLGTILANFRFCRKDMDAYQPDIVILIDYPGFNMPMARYAHKQGYKVFYYIAPQVWAWRKGRIKKLKKYTDAVYTLMPFERRFYEAYQAEALYEGNPLVDSILAYRPDEDFIAKFKAEADAKGDERKLVVILPGSRKQEIKRIFPMMLEVASRQPQFRYVVAGTRNLPDAMYREYLAAYPDIELVYGHTYDLFTMAWAGLVKSGTSTLEAALFDVPEVVCYRTSPVTYAIGRLFVNKQVRFISLVNLIMDRLVVVELLQQDFTVQRLEAEFLKIAGNTAEREKQLLDYAELRKVMGDGGTSGRVAVSIISIFKRITDRRD